MEQQTSHIVRWHNIEQAKPAKPMYRVRVAHPSGKDRFFLSFGRNRMVDTSEDVSEATIMCCLPALDVIVRLREEWGWDAHPVRVL